MSPHEILMMVLLVATLIGMVLMARRIGQDRDEPVPDSDTQSLVHRRIPHDKMVIRRASSGVVVVKQGNGRPGSRGKRTIVIEG